ncbi:hypothetical protein [Algoriphagus sp.]|uniref:hypothetical protein n=1 Tax=Algoriphagus sp. TaxID=1872435 RepID=UPI003F71CB39
MRKLILPIICLITLLVSCKEDEDKVIHTDLPAEANQLFGISQNWNESLYFAMLQWEDYIQMDSLGLPGCPDIMLDSMTKEVTLDFVSSTECIQSGQYTRSGKLIIKYDTSNLYSDKKWSVEYADYKFDNKSLDGIRYFSNTDSVHVSEEFTDLVERTENSLSTEFSGKFLHTISTVIDSLAADSLSSDSVTYRPKLTSFSSIGRISGVNAVGRDIEITMDTPIIHLVECYEQNEILPSIAKESWIVSRGGTSWVTYSVQYEQLTEACQVTAIATLPDGKQLLLNPAEE